MVKNLFNCCKFPGSVIGVLDWVKMELYSLLSTVRAVVQGKIPCQLAEKRPLGIDPLVFVLVFARYRLSQGDAIR